MKCTVEYYDIDSDKMIEKKCFRIDYESNVDFSFCPVDEPPIIFKDVTIKSPTIKMVHSIYGFKMIVEGWQWTKNGYWQTKTIIKIQNEE